MMFVLRYFTYEVLMFSHFALIISRLIHRPGHYSWSLKDASQNNYLREKKGFPFRKSCFHLPPHISDVLSCLSSSISCIFSEVLLL